MAYAESHWLTKKSAPVREAALRLMRGAGIQKRYAVQPLETVFSDMSFEERNDLYVEATKELAAKALAQACLDGAIACDSIDAIITTSCTGFMIPSVDAYLVDKLKMSKSVLRMPITEMGCAGGTAALMYGRTLILSGLHKRVAIVSVETPSLTFQKNDDSMENLVSTAIFADGAAALILGKADDPAAQGHCLPEIEDSDMYHFPNSTGLMGYRLTNSGLKIILDRDVPEQIALHFRKFMDPFLLRNGLEPVNLDHLIFHPGGKKIIQQTEAFFSQYEKNIELSKEVLFQRGNLSSATVLHVLKKTLQMNPKAGDIGYMLAFGPGFSAHSLLLRWKGSS
jgi:alkylresorcinol/alkylpyrone synthase